MACQPLWWPVTLTKRKIENTGRAKVGLGLCGYTQFVPVLLFHYFPYEQLYLLLPLPV